MFQPFFFDFQLNHVATTTIGISTSTTLFGTSVQVIGSHSRQKIQINIRIRLDESRILWDTPNALLEFLGHLKVLFGNFGTPLSYSSDFYDTPQVLLRLLGHTLDNLGLLRQQLDTRSTFTTPSGTLPTSWTPLRYSSDF